MTTTPLPPHVISTDHPNHPSEGWSIAEMVWIDARDKIFQAYATQARADLEAENKRLREALQAIVKSWDNNTFCRERFVKSELGDYWAPTSAMVNSETIAAARAALEKQP